MKKVLKLILKVLFYLLVAVSVLTVLFLTGIGFVFGFIIYPIKKGYDLGLELSEEKVSDFMVWSMDHFKKEVPFEDVEEPKNIDGFKGFI